MSSGWNDWYSLKMQTHRWPPPLTGAEVLEKSWDAQQVHGLFMPSGYFWTLCPRLQKKKKKKQGVHLTFKGKGTEANIFTQIIYLSIPHLVSPPLSPPPPQLISKASQWNIQLFFPPFYFFNVIFISLYHNMHTQSTHPHTHTHACIF